MSHQVPEEEKIIINGGNAGTIQKANAALLEEVCSRIYHGVEAGHTLPNPKKMVLMANEIENLAQDLQKKIFKFQREYLEQVGFEGPWPNSMK